MIKFSKFDKNFVMSVNLADMFLRDAVKKMAECIKRKNSQEAKSYLIQKEKELTEISEKLLEINFDLTDKFSNDDIAQFTKISDRIINSTLKEINGKGM